MSFFGEYIKIIPTRYTKDRLPLVFTQSHVLVGILAEDVPNDHDGLLNHIVDLGLDEVQQRADAALRGLLRGEHSVWREEEPPSQGKYSDSHV